MITREYSARWVTLPHVHVHVHMHVGFSPTCGSVTHLHVGLSPVQRTGIAHTHGAHARCTRKAHMQRADHRRCIAYPYLGQHLACMPTSPEQRAAPAGGRSTIRVRVHYNDNYELESNVPRTTLSTRKPRPPCPTLPPPTPITITLQYGFLFGGILSYLIADAWNSQPAP
jgi:hypothetical protein